MLQWRWRWDLRANERRNRRNPPHKSHPPRVTDETGRTITGPHLARIVSLAPSVTETLFALGLGDRIVGDTTYCDYPPAAKSKPHIGGPIDPSMEAIVALHPDLVIATRSINRQTTVNSLQHLGIAVYATDPHTVEQVLDSTERLSHLIRVNDAGGDPAPPPALLLRLASQTCDLVADLRRRLRRRKNFGCAAEERVLRCVADTAHHRGAQHVPRRRTALGWRSPRPGAAAGLAKRQP